MMAKQMDDLHEKEKNRSIRDVPVPDRTKRSEYFPANNGKAHKSRRRKGLDDRSFFRRKRFLIPTAVVILLVATLGLWQVFSSAVVYITPTKKSIRLSSATISVYPAASLPSDQRISGDAVPYVILSQTVTAKESITPDTVEKVETKASGTITIFNEYSSTPLSLVKNTRFESPSGKIYRIQKVINVPGYKKSGTDIIPGSIDAVVYADEAGDQYNANNIDFTIPGLKGDARYSKTYARSKTAISGGYVGEKGIVSQAQRSEIEKNLKDQANSLVGNVIDSLAPKGSVVIYQLSKETNSSIKETLDDSNNVIYSIDHTISVPAFNKKQLAEVLKPFTGENDTMTFLLDDPTNLSITYKDIFKYSGVEDITISGEAIFSADPRTSEIATSIKSSLKTGVQSKLTKFPEIDKASIVLSPPWGLWLPSSVDRISFVIKTN